MHCHCLDGRIQGCSQVEEDNHVNRLLYTVLGRTAMRYAGLLKLRICFTIVPPHALQFTEEEDGITVYCL
jgi:hypothetical protein